MKPGIVINFGDVFRYLDKTFVFLAESAPKNIIYAARILNSEDSLQMKKLNDKYQYKPNYNQHSTAFSIVVLRTQEFEDCVAWLHNPDHDSSDLRSPYTKLDEDDLKQIKTEILEGNNFPAELKEKLSQTT